MLNFVSCAVIDKSRTADYQTTRGILEILARDGNRDDILAFLADRNLPGDEIIHNTLADEILQSPPAVGLPDYLERPSMAAAIWSHRGIGRSRAGDYQDHMSQVGLHVAEAVAVYAIHPASTPLTGLLPPATTIDLANQTLRYLTGIQDFFTDREALDAFLSAVTTPVEQAISSEKQWGDFQTPPKLARQVYNYLAASGISPRVIIEPTYGVGNFILAALDVFTEVELVYGVEIQEKYAWRLKMALLARALQNQRSVAEIELYQDDIFTHRFAERVRRAQDVLIIGNPPWVTNAALGTLGASNLPVKRNIKALNGLDAVTGKSNFDLGEYVLLRMLELFSDQRGTLAMLCKNAVIRNIVAAMPQRRFKVANVRASGNRCRKSVRRRGRRLAAGDGVGSGHAYCDLSGRHPR